MLDEKKKFRVSIFNLTYVVEAGSADAARRDVVKAVRAAGKVEGSLGVQVRTR